MDRHKFGKMLRSFRLRAEFRTLTEFGDELQELGFFQEDSTFSRWENGSRIPRNRDLIIEVIKLFVSRSGITTLNEANNLLESAGHGFLTKKEQSEIWLSHEPNVPFQAPRDIPYFTGRKSYLKKLTSQLIKGSVLLIHGLPGSGKTALSIKIAHLLKSEFTDGVLWFKLDTTSKLDVLVGIGEALGTDVSKINDPYIAASMIRSLLSKKRVLIVYDNVDSVKDLELLIPNSSNSSVLITSKFAGFNGSYITDKVKLRSFDESESLKLFKNILREKYKSFSKETLIELSRIFNNLPLAINIIASYLKTSEASALQIIGTLKKEKIELNTFEYESTDLLTAIGFVFKKLNNKTQNFLLSLKVFRSTDFSTESCAYINNLSKKDTKKNLNYLIEASLVEHSSNSRYRLHPVIKFYIDNMKISPQYTQRAIEYYISFLKKNKEKTNYFTIIQPEIYNIEGLLEQQISVSKVSENLLELLEKANSFLWYRGYWFNYKNLNKAIHKFAIHNRNKELSITSSTNLGKAYYWLGELEKSKEYTKQSIELAKDQKNDEFLSVNLDRLGKIYQVEGRFDKSDKVLKAVLTYFETGDKHEEKGNVLRHIGEGHLFKQNYDDAIIYFHQALSAYLYIKAFSIKNMYQSLIHSHLATAYYLKKDLIKAEKLYIKSLIYEKKAGGRAGTKIGCMLGLALIFKQKKSEKHKWYLKKAREEIETLGIRQNIDKLVVSYRALRNELVNNELSIA
jgi:tetratricopeptide (TPR) repeat protein